MGFQEAIHLPGIFSLSCGHPGSKPPSRNHLFYHVGTQEANHFPGFISLSLLCGRLGWKPPSRNNFFIMWAFRKQTNFQESSLYHVGFQEANNLLGMISSLSTSILLPKFPLLIFAPYHLTMYRFQEIDISSCSIFLFITFKNDTTKGREYWISYT